MRNPKLPLFFDQATGDYWLQIGPRFSRMKIADLKLHLQVRGLDDFQLHPNLERMDAVRFWAQTERAVDYAGALAGHPVGPFETTDGRRILVTSTRRTWQPVEGDTDSFDRLLAELLPDGQSVHFLYWLKCAVASLSAGDFRPGQLVTLAGESGCGKSFLQLLITEILGGREAQPMRYFIGDTAFNSDMTSSEHWSLSDDKGISMDIRARRNFGEAIKESVVVTKMSVHAKGKDSVTLPTWRRLTMSVNSEPENLSKLPPMDDSILDKVILFQCGKAELGEDRAKNWKKFTKEIPALLFALEQITIPKGLRCTRYGVKSWHHPRLLEILTDMSPEQRLLNLIDEVIDFREGPWTGTSIALEKELRESKLGFAADKVLSWSGAAGTYLARLAQTHPQRFLFTRTATTRRWTITSTTK
jgi:energy-coupling factor transporter ATP-binding protein EcfA2